MRDVDTPNRQSAVSTKAPATAACDISCEPLKLQFPIDRSFPPKILQLSRTIWRRTHKTGF